MRKERWAPERGFLPYRWEGYDEAALLYVLGLGCLTHPLTAESYVAWASTYQWKEIYGYEFIVSGASDPWFRPFGFSVIPPCK
jgi:hypothetical protein